MGASEDWASLDSQQQVNFIIDFMIEEWAPVYFSCSKQYNALIKWHLGEED